MKKIKVELVTGEIYALCQLKGLEEIHCVGTGHIDASAGDWYIRCQHDFKQAGKKYTWNAVVPLRSDDAENIIRWNSHIVQKFEALCGDFPNCSYKYNIGRKRGKVEASNSTSV